MAEATHGLGIWVANNSTGEPVCIAGALEDGRIIDAGLCVNLYTAPDDRTGGVAILGVEVTEQEETIARAGWFPAAVVEEELSCS